MTDHAWYLSLKSALKTLTDSDRDVIKTIWKYPGVPVFHLPERMGRSRGGMIWLAIGSRIAKGKLWTLMPKHIRQQNERTGYRPFYSGVLVYLTTVVDRDRRRLICFDLHEEAVKALKELKIISGPRPRPSSAYTPLGVSDQDSISITKSMPAETTRTLRSIIARRGQPEFRRKLLQAYEGRCAVTNSDQIETLEAAHIRNFVHQGRYDVRNGVLLRSDWHTLLDLGLWTIHPKTCKIIVSSALSDSNYIRFSGRKVRFPQDPKCAPSEVELARRYRSFKSRQTRAID